MLTRIEIDGFKTFHEFALDLAPFTVVLGPNASGKSNLFDAIHLLSRLARMDLRDAVRDLRGEPHELFRRDPDGSAGNRIILAAEVLLDPQVSDPWGSLVTIKHSRVRYEVAIERRHDDRGIERLVVVKEKAQPILSKEDRWRPELARSSKEFRDALVKYSRSVAWLETETGEGGPEFRIRQDGHQGRTRPARAAEATILSSISSAEFPHLYALREELRSWQFLQLEPAALRKPSPTIASEALDPNGGNLPTVLARIRAETTTPDQPNGALTDIAADLTSLIPGALGVEIEEDKDRREFRVDITTRENQRPFSSRVVSDGTLRILAVLTLLHDPRHRGLVCFEEPENGIHPLRLRDLIQRLRDLTSDPSQVEIEPEAPLTQILLNSHSPVVLSALKTPPSTGPRIYFCDLATVVDPTKQTTSRRTRIRPVRLSDQVELFPSDESQPVSSFEVEEYLNTARSGP